MKRKRIAGVCITLAAVVLAGTFDSIRKQYKG